MMKPNITLKPGNLFQSLNSQSGFSLLEVLVASAIASMVLVLVYTSYKSIITSIKKSTGYADFYENVNLAVTKIDHDISNTYYSKNNKNLTFTCEQEGESSVLNFVTVNYNDYRLSGSESLSNPESDVHEVGYYLREDKETIGLYYLIKREERHYDEEPQEGGTENILLENVVSTKFEFKKNNDWTDNWDSRQNNRFPKAVKTTLVVKNYENKEEEFVFISFVNLKSFR